MASPLLSPGLPLGGEYSCLDSNCSHSLRHFPPSPLLPMFISDTHSPSQRCAFTGALAALQWPSLCGALDLLWQVTHLGRTGTCFPPLIKNEFPFFSARVKIKMPNCSLLKSNQKSVNLFRFSFTFSTRHRSSDAASLSLGLNLLCKKGHTADNAHSIFFVG